MKRIIFPVRLKPLLLDPHMPPTSRTLVHVKPFFIYCRLRFDSFALFTSRSSKRLFSLKYCGAPFDKRLQTLPHIFAFHDLCYILINNCPGGFFTLKSGHTA